MAKFPHAARKHPPSRYGNHSRMSGQQRATPTQPAPPYSVPEREDRDNDITAFMRWPFYLFERMMNPWRSNTTSVISWMDSWRVGRLTVPKSQSTETATAYHYMIELPGVPRNRIALRFENGVITLQVEGRKNNGNKYKYGQRYWKAVRRSFVLPVYADSSAISADYKDDVLTIAIPKADKPLPAEPRIIEIA